MSHPYPSDILAGMNRSSRGERYTAHTGILQLMDDLGNSLTAMNMDDEDVEAGIRIIAAETEKMWKERP